eukprot:1142646-Pelagomonas_calceolata.AAC.4
MNKILGQAFCPEFGVKNRHGHPCRHGCTAKLACSPHHKPPGPPLPAIREWRGNMCVSKTPAMVRRQTPANMDVYRNGEAKVRDTSNGQAPDTCKHGCLQEWGSKGACGKQRFQ